MSLYFLFERLNLTWVIPFVAELTLAIIPMYGIFGIFGFGFGGGMVKKVRPFCISIIARVQSYGMC